MASSFYSNNENFDRIFFTDTQFIDRYIGNRAFGTGANLLFGLGDGTTTSRSSFVDFTGLGSTWKQVCGHTAVNTGTFGLGVKTDGTLWSWGYNANGQLGSGNTTSRSSPITVAGGGTDWYQVSCGNNTAAAVKRDGSLWTWGSNSAGVLGDGTTTNRSSPVSITTSNNWIQVAVASTSQSTYHAAAIKTDGSLWTWGANPTGQLGDGTTTNRSSPGTTAGGGFDWAKVSVGGQSSAAIKNDGTLWTWGRNAYTVSGAGVGTGILGDGSTTDRSSPQTVAGGGTTWKQVSVSAGASIGMAAIKIDGTLWTWGNNSGGFSANAGGRLGDGTTTARSSPQTVAGGGTTWKQVSCGYTHTAAIKTDGSMWTWGVNVRGQLGTGNTTPRSSPGTISGGVAEWTSVDADGYASSTGTTFGSTRGIALFIGGG
jgi:alpha-tubulin suppressor-like RCC1 family protein